MPAGVPLAQLPDVVLLSNSAGGTSAAYAWAGGQGEFKVVGTFGAATVKLQFLGPDGVTWLDVGTSTTLTAPGAGLFTLGPCQLQAITVGGAPTGIYASASRVTFRARR